MIIKNVKVFTEDKKFKTGDIYIENGMLVKKFTTINEEIIDGKGAYAIPGLIDIHLHGCKGYDFCDGTKDAICKIAKYEASVGVTAIVPATMTLSVNKLKDVLKTVAKYKNKDKMNSDVIGVNMEGPFISKIKKGAQDGNYIIKCNESLCEEFINISQGMVKFIGIAPEENKNVIDFIRKFKDKVNISLAHTDSDYDTAMMAFNAGANHVTHLYNAMSSFRHRAPGVVGAVYDSKNVVAELICDGIHVHPSVVRATFDILGEDRIALISDSIRATGMPDGSYTLGGLDVNVVGNRATLTSNGALAGSVTNLLDCVRIAVKEMKIPLEQAITSATMTPAKSIGEFDKYGSISIGKKANVLLLDKKLNLKMIIKDGKILKFTRENI